MSVLAMILTATMAIPGDVPEKVSGEMVRGLDLRGEWEGIWVFEDGVRYKAETIEDGKCARVLTGTKNRETLYLGDLDDIVDEGEGRLRGKWYFWRDTGAVCWYEGIYRQDGDSLTICFRGWQQSRPTSFRAGNDQHLLILHRVESRK